jgi:predicted secreted protein
VNSYRLDQPVSGDVVRLAPGDVLEIRLVQQSGGGYLWSVAETSAELELVEDRNQPGALPGAAATRLFTFRAMTPGSSRLVLVHARPWERTVEDTRVELDVEITPDNGPG